MTTLPRLLIGFFAIATTAESWAQRSMPNAVATNEPTASLVAPALRDGPSRRADRRSVRRGLARLSLQARGGGRQGAAPADQVTESFSRTLPFPRSGTLDLQNFAGEIVVTGARGDDIRIEAVKRVRPRGAVSAQELLAEMTIVVEDREDRIEVRTESPRRRAWPGVVDFTVTLPAGANVTVRSASGRVRVTNVDGDLRLQTASGDISATDVKGLSRIRTVSGQIDVRNAEGREILGGSVSGLVSLVGVKARALDLQSVSGDLRVGDAELERVIVRTVSGDVEYGGSLARAGRYELRAHSGDIRVMPRGDASFQLDAATFSGDVRSDFELSNVGVAGGRRGRGLGLRREGGAARRLQGVSRDGGAMLALQSFSGDIVVAR